MAKLKAPLLSFGASGAIAKAVVYFPWKGLNVAREYVIPSNPKTGPQTTQRGYLTAVVARIHALQADVANPFNAVDATAYALWGSIFPTPRTWFNQVVKNWLDQKVAGKIPCLWHDGGATGQDKQLTFGLRQSPESSGVTNGNIHYGTSKTALINTIAATPAELITGKVIPNLTNGVKYFVQYRPTAPTTFKGSYSGIYYATPKA